ncbi:abscission/NoCut checkpoint regulator isoform X2 [Bicyclus anynana]|uniref:Abscission/NoCut checkpoint regulator isoform X2 n=1 Tax=Bicyclus anynana TaxID=110368 RepID=A0ABM3LY69_BICAN|nr:abscission/NoCut checkpoint regulator isoform X2 [Bicyclus anynana]
MACNTCAKTFSIFRPEKGCPSCGFSYCSKCLKNKVFLKKFNSEVMVCAKCKQLTNSNEPNEPKNVIPPDAYYKRMGITESATGDRTSENAVEDEISDRLKKLKEGKQDNVVNTNSNDAIADRLQKLKGDIPSTSDAELRSRLANIKGVPQVTPTILPKKTEQEQIDDLMRQYMEQGTIDKKYEDEFDGLVSDIEGRLQRLKGAKSSDQDKVNSQQENNDNSEDEEETVKKIVAKVTAEAKLEGNIDSDPVLDELPFCEICNEDAKMRCLGCKYLFCKNCFKEHADSDDGCDKYELYSPPKNFVM